MRLLLALAVAMALLSCRHEDEKPEDLVRGLKTYLIEDSERSIARRFPSVLEPKSLNALSFEVSGKLEEIDLSVGQRVVKGEILAALATDSFRIQIENADAGVASARAAAENSASELARQEELLEHGATTRVNVENTRTEMEVREAQLVQALKSLESARENLSKSELRAPFDGIINSVGVQSFATIAPGAVIASIYPPDSFEVSFSVNFDVVNQLVVGSPASVRLADRPDITLPAQVSEVGSRADAVSSFPIVLTVLESDPILKAGMAVEATIELPLFTGEGYAIPLSAMIMTGSIQADRDGPQSPLMGQVYLYDETSRTVRQREVTIAGVRENSLLVIDGLEPGDRIAAAGVTFLRDGQEVRLLPEGE